MAATLRGGLSLGVCGFSFWSHDVGGFVQSAPEDIYRRWTPFGMLSSHVRSHGAPPTEPWEYGEDFMNAFRQADEMRYRLMPYIYAQARECSSEGWPMFRALFVEFPDDQGSWLVDDEYLLGSRMLVAPLLESVTSRDVYLPEGNWIDYQTGKAYKGGWHHIEAGEIPIVVLIREGSVIPHIALAQSTKFMDWSRIELRVYGSDPEQATGLLCLPSDNTLRKLSVSRERNNYGGQASPAAKGVRYSVELVPGK
jgi:alpha-D-xyloside xylohydrolase